MTLCSGFAYQQPTEVTQTGQLVHPHSPWPEGVSQHGVNSMEEKEHAAAPGNKPSSVSPPAAGPLGAPFCEQGQEEPFKMTSSRPLTCM